MSTGSPAAPQKTPARTFVGFLGAACLALAALVVGLALRNRALEAQVRELGHLVAAAERPALVQGEPFPDITLLDGAGRPVQIADGSAVLLFLSSSTCDYCEDVRPTWNGVARLAEGSGLRVLELVLDAEPETLTAGAVGHPRLAPGDDAWSLSGRIPGVPAALLIDVDGTVRRAFYGTEHAGLEAAVEELLLAQ